MDRSTGRAGSFRWGFLSLGLFLAGMACWPLILVVGGGLWREGGHGPGQAVHLVLILSVVLLGLCLTASIAGSVMSKDVKQRILSLVCLAITAYMAIQFGAGLVGLLGSRGG